MSQAEIPADTLDPQPKQTKKQKTKRNWKKLLTAVEFSRRDLEKARREQRTAVIQYVGEHYSTSGIDDSNGGVGVGGRSGGSSEPRPVNFLNVIVDTQTTFLAANRPQTSVTTKHESLRIPADRLQMALNHLLGEIDFEHTVQRSVQDYMFSVGIVKTGITPMGKVVYDNETHQVGQPYAETIQFDDFVWDTSARDFSECAYMGHFYRLPLRYIQDSGLYDKDKVDLIKASTNKDTDEDGNPDLQAVGTDYYHVNEDSEYEDQVNLFDVYLQHEGATLTFAWDMKETLGPIREEKWAGPEGGPYDFLYDVQPPGNVRPLPPVFMWMDIDELDNKLYRKLAMQAERAKSVGIAESSDTEVAKAVMDSGDGDVVSGHGAPINELKMGGIDGGNMAFFMQSKDLLMGPLSGNTEALAGLGALTETAKQDKMIRDSASVRIGRSQDALMRFTIKVIKKLAWYLFHDPFIDLPATKRLPNTGMEINFRITEEDMEGDFLDYNFDIEPYSMQYQSPQEKRNKIHAVLQDTIFPLLPVMEKQGMQLDLQRLVEIDAELLNIPELTEIISSAEPEMGEGPYGEAPGKIEAIQPQQPKEVINRNISTGGTQQGRDAAMAQTLLNGNANPDQQAALTRPREA